VLWRRQRVSRLAASKLPTLSMQSLLMRGDHVSIQVAHPAKGLRPGLVRDAGQWVGAGMPWVYGDSPPARVDVVVGEPGDAKRWGSYPV
jgi:hypothetical protein